MSDKKYHIYGFSGVVRRTVIDDIKFTCRASSVEEARKKAQDFLGVFPDASLVDGIDYAYIDNRTNVDSEILSLDLLERSKEIVD